LLDLLAVPAAEREFSALAPERRMEPGATLPPPSAIFPRYVEAEEKA
jgi:methionyl-tRNA synthetase